MAGWKQWPAHSQQHTVHMIRAMNTIKANPSLPPFLPSPHFQASIQKYQIPTVFNTHMSAVTTVQVPAKMSPTLAQDWRYTASQGAEGGGGARLALHSFTGSRGGGGQDWRYTASQGAQGGGGARLALHSFTGSRGGGGARLALHSFTGSRGGGGGGKIGTTQLHREHRGGVGRESRVCLIAHTLPTADSNVGYELCTQWHWLGQCVPVQRGS